MTRITLAIATVLSLAFTPLAAQETNCDGWFAIANDYDVWRPFWEAATVDTVSDCLNAGADVNARDDGGHTPFHRAAAINKNPEVLTLLLSAGGDVNARDQYGLTPLHAAIFSNNPDILTVLGKVLASPLKSFVSGSWRETWYG